MCSDAKLHETLEMLRNDIRLDLATGFANLTTQADYAAECLADEYDVEVLRFHAHEILREELAALLERQQEWPSITDCDRLNAAFAELESNGVLCRQHYSCCSSCGVVEIHEEIDNATKVGNGFRGYTFYSTQDTAIAMGGDGLHLDYGSTKPDEKASIRIGNEVASTLKAQGLEVDWDGTINRRIRVRLDWKRRTPAHGTQ